MVKELVPQITSAIEGSDFEIAEPLLSEFFAGLERDLAQITDLQDRAAFLQDALGWMHRWLSLSRVMRSHLNEQLRLNVRDTSYYSAADPFSTVDFTA